MVKEMSILAFLVWNSLRDIRKREISLILTVAFGVWGLLGAWHSSQLCWTYFIPILTGGLFIGLSFITGNKIGVGDGLLLTSLGTMLGGRRFLCTLCLAMLGCGLWSVLLLLLFQGKRNTEIPFVPFVLLGYLGGFFL